MKRRIKNLTPAEAVDLVLSLAEHAGEPYPETRVARGFGSVVWAVGTRMFRVVVMPTWTEVQQVDAESVVTLRIERDLIATVRDGLDWLMGIPLDRGPIPLPESESGKET